MGTGLIRLIKAAAFYLYNAFLSKYTPYAIRHFYLRVILKIQLGCETSVHMGCFFTGNHVKVGNHTILNRDCFFDGRSELVIGDNVSIGAECSFLTMSHDPQSPDFEPIRRKTVIEDYVWTGYRAMILPGVVVGKGAVVGAGSVVTKSVEPYTIVAGNPARKIGERTRDLTYALRYRPFFNTDIE